MSGSIVLIVFSRENLLGCSKGRVWRRGCSVGASVSRYSRVGVRLTIAVKETRQCFEVSVVRVRIFGIQNLLYMPDPITV